MRVSTGKVKLRSTPNGLMFTVPKSVSESLGHYVGVPFECHINDDSGKLEVCFESLRAVRNFTLKIGGKEV